MATCEATEVVVMAVASVVTYMTATVVAKWDAEVVTCVVTCVAAEVATAVTYVVACVVAEVVADVIDLLRAMRWCWCGCPYTSHMRHMLAIRVRMLMSA